MSGEEWNRVMRAIWLLNTIQVELSHLGIPLMRVPPSLHTLGDILAQAEMSEQDRQLIEDELTRAYASLAQAAGELQAGMVAIETLLHRPVPPQWVPAKTTDTLPERERSIVWLKS